MIVVCDTNVWLSELGLRSGAGSALRVYLNHQGARLALPEVVRLEVVHNLRTRLLGHIERTRIEHSQLLTVFGRLKEVVLPGEAEVEVKVAEVFASLGVELVEIPFSLESAQASFLKTIQKAPPSDRTQEFKDGVIWSDCLSLLAEAPVTLVTEDKAFYKDRTYSRGLAATLQAEVDDLPNPLTLVPSLTDVLASVKSDIELDYDKLAEAYLASHGQTLNDSLLRLGFAMDERLAARHDLFATEDPESLFMTFELHYAGVDVRGEGRTDVVIRLSGDGTYRPGAGEFSALRNFGERWLYREADGTERENKNVVLFADSIVIGHREVSHSVRYRLTGEGGRGEEGGGSAR